MIGRLKGKVDERDEESVILDVGGVGYTVFCPSRTLAKLAEGEACTLTIETHVREDHIHLYGFADTSEREWFRLLTTVQGVGAKMGLALLGAFSPDQLTIAIASGDTAMLSRVSGVGPKLATRIATELKNKVAKMPVVVPISSAPAKPGKSKGKPAPASTALEDAVSALVNLGYGRAEAFTAVATAQGMHGQNAAVDALIKDGLKALAK